MAVGPVQLLVFGFEGHSFFGSFLFSIVFFPAALIVASMVSDTTTTALASAGRMGNHWETGGMEAFSDAVVAIGLRLEDVPVEGDRPPCGCVSA